LIIVVRERRIGAEDQAVVEGHSLGMSSRSSSSSGTATTGILFGLVLMVLRRSRIAWDCAFGVRSLQIRTV